MDKEYFGIDFGTTNIAIAGLTMDTADKTAYRTFYGDENGFPFPSLVAVDEHRNVVYGAEVRSRSADLQEKGYTVIKSVKTRMGSGEPIRVGNTSVTPVEAADYLIRCIRKCVAQDGIYPATIREATVAVPVGFTQGQREDVIRAFADAGITVTKIVSEPVAAYVSNRDAVRNKSNVLVFDWGGGTLDLSLLNVEDGAVNEIATEGWPVAGDKIDESLADYVHGRLVSEGKTDVPFRDISEKDRVKILLECEQAKMAFSDGDEEYGISLLNYCGNALASLVLERGEFEERIMPIVEAAIGYIDVVLDKADMRRIDLQALIMVGGSSNLLPLQNRIRQIFPDDRCLVVYPDKPQWSVAEGAAVMGSVRSGYTLNQDIGVMMGGFDYGNQEFFPILRKGTRIPWDGESFSFCVTDCGPSANFIIADDRHNLIGRIVMPSHGFVGEKYTVSGRIDNTLLATVTVTGEYMGNTTEPRIVSIGGLSVRCDISEILNYEFRVR